MAQVHGVYYITDEGRISASDFREGGRQPETADEVDVEFDCPICDERQDARTTSPVPKNEQHVCDGSCGETYYLYPMTALESGSSLLTMPIEERIEQQLNSIEKFYPIDKSVGKAGVEMLSEIKVAIAGGVAVILAFLGVLFYSSTIDLTVLTPQTISFILVAGATGIGAFAVLQGAIAPVFRGYIAYRNVRGRVDYSFLKFVRHAANYHHRKPF